MSTSALAIIVEPDSLIRDVLRVELSNAHYTALIAEDAEDAEDMAARLDAQMIVLDVSQVKLPGYSACARIRRRPGYGTRPIILTARRVETRDAAAADAAGATALLAKPYSVSALFRVVGPHLAADDPLRASTALFPRACLYSRFDRCTPLHACQSPAASSRNRSDRADLVRW